MSPVLAATAPKKRTLYRGDPRKKAAKAAAPKTVSSFEAEALYVSAKVRHMIRMGIPASTGGRYGGACPDWLKGQQEAEADARLRRDRIRASMRARR